MAKKEWPRTNGQERMAKKKIAKKKIAKKNIDAG
jgi:hypothetical protein